jgi:hypothetical protein
LLSIGGIKEKEERITSLLLFRPGRLEQLVRSECRT